MIRLEQASDDELLAACRRGDEAAWAEVVRRYERLVRSVALANGLPHDRTDDLTQLVFSILIDRLDSFRPNSRLAPWLSTVARRQTWRMVKARMREAPVEEVSEEAPVGPGADDRMADAEWIRAGLERLPVRCRQLLEALYLWDSEPNYEQIAEALDMPIGSIGPTRKRCLDRLRAILQEDAGGDDRADTE